MSRRRSAALLAVFAGTGFSALTLQVVWQRVISAHAGVDLSSFITVVAAFLGGIGLGSLLGGWLADRLGPRRSLAAFAASNAGIGVFAWFSVWLFYDFYRSMVPSLESTFASFAFNVGLLIVPATLMGLSLPLLAKGVVERVSDAASLIGRLYGINTMGAGVGAAVSGWFLLGNLGLVGTVRLAACINLAAAAVVLLLWRSVRDLPARAGASPLATPETPGTPGMPGAPGATVAGGRVWPWFVIYGLTGAVALGLEVVFFRLVDAIMRSNSYTFGHVLMLYLLLFGAGSAVAARFVARVSRPDRMFLGLQFGVGVAALAGLLVLIELPGLLGIDGPLRRQFAIDGYNLGEYRFTPPQELARLLFVHLGAPLLVMGAPVLLMGASFPFVQALVAQRSETLGRRTGLLLFSNITGNVAGTLIVGFALINWLGTSGTVRLLAGVLVVAGVAAAATFSGVRRFAYAGGAVVVLVGAVAVFPSNRELWSFLHSARDLRFELQESRSCVNALRETGEEDLVFINATSQNGYPFDEFHPLIGLLPALTHPAPRHAMAVGLGVGATPFGMTIDPRLEAIDVVEICAGQEEILGRLAERGAPELRGLLGDDRVTIKVGDGRKHLLRTDDRYDVLTVDVVRPQSAFSGNLYSVEFYELVRSRLAPGGILAQWAASGRTLASVLQVFPYVVGFTVASYNESQFFLASNEPIPFDAAQVRARFQAALAAGRAPPGAEWVADIASFLESNQPVAHRAGGPPPEVPDEALNHDLFPRDEYFLNTR